ncbi:putative capsid protein [Circoviridae sp.]|nr:putative capsid protein [Circoviridae sp.]
MVSALTLRRQRRNAARRPGVVQVARSLLTPQNIRSATSLLSSLVNQFSSRNGPGTVVSSSSRPRPPSYKSGSAGAVRPAVRKVKKYGLPSGPINHVTRGRKVTKQDPYKVNMKVEKGESYVGWHCMYPGGVTHPLYYTFYSLSLAMIRFFMMKAKVEFGSWNDKPMMPLVTNCFWFVRYYTKAEGDLPDQLRAVSVDMSNQSTWEGCAVKLANSFVATFGSTQQILRITNIGIHPDLDISGKESFVASQLYNARDIYITVKGESHLQVQNRTLADTSVGDSADATNIFNNPMRGKYYSFKNGRPFIRNIAYGTASQRSSFENTFEGVISQQDRYTSGGTNGSNFSDAVADEIRKPPNGNYFVNCTNAKFCRVLPGAILTSRATSTVTHSLNTWLSIFKNKFDMVGTKTLDGLRANADPLDYRVGVSHMYGLEKMVDTDRVQGNQLEIGIEHNLFMSTKMQYRPTIGSVAIVKITT